MSRISDPRSDELGHLKLALATFEVHLEVFEMQAQEVMLSIGKPGTDAPQAVIDRAPGKDDLSGRQ